MYVSGGFTQEQIDEFFGAKPKKAQVLTEAPANNKGLDQMNKLELEALAREKGVELDRRKSKATLLQTVKELFS